MKIAWDVTLMRQPNCEASNTLVEPVASFGVANAWCQPLPTAAAAASVNVDQEHCIQFWTGTHCTGNMKSACSISNECIRAFEPNERYPQLFSSFEIVAA